MYSNIVKRSNKRIYEDFKLKKNLMVVFTVCIEVFQRLNLFEPEFTIVIFIHNKPLIAVAILDL